MGCFGSKSGKIKVKLCPETTESVEKDHSLCEESKHAQSKGNLSEDSRVIAKLKTLNNIYRIVVNAEKHDQSSLEEDQELSQDSYKKTSEGIKTEIRYE
ncbi:unnamed protein product [Blepharisma stoltei]|uniref:Uncharacterized protein n=1 Tax=Blepharisma stoltei TaxID=1481888 RepID=A0AAU9JEK7_9CILI|nr:unnamed protein product [Blepharisma stoltei]